MRTALLNLPYPLRIMRRYTCAYNAPNFLFPPLELMYLSSIIKEWKKDDCILIDAIAEGLSIDKVIMRLRSYQPDLLVFMAGIESFSGDMQMIVNIKSNFPILKIAAIGYLPSIFPKETLENNSAIDYIIMNEPEISFSELYDEIKAFTLTNVSINGIAKRCDNRVIIGKERARIKDLDTLPFPNRSLIKQELYNEFLLKRPFTTILTSRGCPFECTFCIRTYGKEIVHRSVKNVLAEIEEAILSHKIKAIRFMDDTFSLNKERVVRLCESILEKGLKFQWSALSRIGMMDKEMLSLMKKVGCKRLYLGIETSSQRILDYYRKGYKANLIKTQVRMIKENNIETVGFFMVGGIQNEEEFKKDVVLAKQLDLDYIVVEKIKPYPGTPLFEHIKNMDFKNALKWEKIFYRDFYLRPKYIVDKLGDFSSNIKDVIAGMDMLWRYLILRQSSILLK